MSKINAIAQYFTPTNLYDSKINQSLRFDSGSSSKLTRTPSSEGNRRTFTISVWMKRTNIDAKVNFLDVLTDGGATFSQFYVESGATYGDKLGFYSIASGTDYGFFTDAVYRDVSSWYHVVFRVDTTDATADNRVRVYVNGTEQAVTNTYGQVPQNYDFHINRTLEHNIGYNPNTGVYSNGYFAEYHFIDGTALAPTSFGETKSGIWIAKKYTGSYGTNGFYLDFADGSALGDDESGNGNDFTSSGLASTDVVLDSPTNNFATLNPLYHIRDTGTFSEGNLQLTSDASNNCRGYSTFNGLMTSGKWYGEVRVNTINVSSNYGVNVPLYIRQDSGSGNALSVQSYYISVYKLSGVGTNMAGSAIDISAFTAGDIFMFAVDADNGNAWIGKNGQWYDSSAGFTGDPSNGSNATATFTAGNDIWIFCDIRNEGGGTQEVHYNFGQDDSFAGTVTPAGNTDANGRGSFKYSVPNGFLSLCSLNLPEPSISPLHGEQPEDYFNTVLWTGDGQSDRDIVTGHATDLVWIKHRTSAYSHRLADKVRGATKHLYSNSTQAEGTDTTEVTAFNSDGFQIGSSLAVNESPQPIVAWSWVAGGSAVSNTDGGVTSQVSANTEAGFSIVTYTAASSLPHTVGHGLDEAPELVIYKNRDSSEYWLVGWDGQSGKGLKLDDTDAAFTTSGWNTMPTATTINHNINTNDDYVAYCFHSVPGYSLVSSYTGNGSSDGPFVHCGFRPAFVLYKRTDASGDDWQIQDAARDTYNEVNLNLNPNSNGSEGTNTSNNNVDFLSNGFKVRANNSAQNASSGTYIFIAFAEQPFKYSNAR